eukprot:7384162-Prymnesium_polylepis.1
MNALLVVGEELSASGGRTTLSLKPFETARIIILQIGNAARGGSPHPCLPQALTAVAAAEGGAVLSGVCLSLHVASALLAGMPPGLAIASTDSIIALPADSASKPLPMVPEDGDAGLVVTVPLPLEQARAHGVCVPVVPSLDHGRVVPRLGRILYRGTDEQLRAVAAPDGTVPVYTGLLCLAARTATRLLELHVRSPLDACTCLGIDSGTPPLRLDLHADVLAPLGAAEEAWFIGLADCGDDGTADPRLQAARRVLWAGLRCGGGDATSPSELGALRLATAHGCSYLYLAGSAEHQRTLLGPSPILHPTRVPAVAAVVQAAASGDDDGLGWRSPARPPKPAMSGGAALC